MYAEIDNDMIVRTIAAYDELTDLIHENLVKSYSDLYHRLEQKEKDELIYVASIPGSKIYRQVMPQDVSEAYEHYIDLCKDQIRDTYHSIRALTERQETMNRIMTCYKVLPKREHQILQIMYEENGGFTAGIIAATSELNIGRTTVMRWRRRALASIKRLYAMDQSQMAMIQEGKHYK